MDMLMEAQNFNNGVPSAWDIFLMEGVTPALYEREEKQQLAAVACFLERGTVPGIEQTGIQWQEYLTGSLEARELDAQLREAINVFTDSTDFIPYYFEKNNRLQLSIQEARSGN